MTELPQRFKERMRELLGNEYEAFEASYEQEKVQGLRFNSLKTKRREENLTGKKAGVKTLAAETSKTLKYGINAGSLGKRRLLLPVRCKTWQTPVP